MKQFNAMLPKHNARGMTLIEIMVAMTIFAVVLTGILPLSIFVISYARENTHIMQARNVMANTVEQLRILPANNAWRTDAPNDTSDLNDNTTGDVNVTNGIYTVRWNIANRPDNTQDIRIFVNWTANNVPKSISGSVKLIR